MKMVERVQAVIYTLEVGRGAPWLRALALTVSVLALAVLYDALAYRNFSAPEAMDAAQVARNVAKGRGFTTDFIRPFSIYLVQKHNRAAADDVATNALEWAQLNSGHPDLANPPVYPLLLAGWMKAWPPEWRVQMKKPFWSENGGFARYEPEFRIAILNQLLLLAVVVLTFVLARMLFDWQAAWLSTILVLGSDVLWKFSVSGLSTLLLLVIFLGLAICLAKIEMLARVEKPGSQRILWLALAAGALTALGMMTRYSFGWVIVPVVIFLQLFGGARRGSLAVAAMLAFFILVAPWTARNITVSGTYFGTAGYAAAEETVGFPETNLPRSLSPELSGIYQHSVQVFGKKLLANSRPLFQNDLPRLAGWLGILFFAGLLMRLRQNTARCLRFFTVMCLAVLFIVQALGKTYLTYMSPEINSENLLVLLVPLAVIFGAVTLLTLLAALDLPTVQVRLTVVAIVVLIAWQPLASTLLPPRVAPTSYPPYYPPDIQKIAGWMDEDELIMSDVPWAVAWYGHQQCAWNTINSQYTFFQLNDYIKPLRGLYFTPLSADARVISECLQGSPANWKLFTLRTLFLKEALPADFPLKVAPAETIVSGLFLTDRIRW
jgi:4-amino-4-deoxy-L-arabinose transferase-like glycosyltransferase